jgi:hypothetical protein
MEVSFVALLSSSDAVVAMLVNKGVQIVDVVPGICDEMNGWQFSFPSEFVETGFADP